MIILISGLPYAFQMSNTHNFPARKKEKWKKREKIRGRMTCDFLLGPPRNQKRNWNALSNHREPPQRSIPSNSASLFPPFLSPPLPSFSSWPPTIFIFKWVELEIFTDPQP